MFKTIVSTVIALAVVSGSVLVAAPAQAATVKVCGVTLSYSGDITTMSKTAQAADVAKTVKTLKGACQFRAVAAFNKSGPSLYAAPKKGVRGDQLQSFYNKLSVAEIKAAILKAGGTLF